MILRPFYLTLLACALPVTLAYAHEGATGVVKERMDLMDSQKDAMKVIGDMAKDKTPFDAEAAAKAANEIAT
ncbi:MAG: cytochrome c, partial [Methyloceanibacter sp.]